MTKFVIDGEEVEKREFEERLEEDIRADAEDGGFDTMLDECHEGVEILGYIYDLSEVLRKVDEVVYNEKLKNYVSYTYDDAMYDLERGNTFQANRSTYEIVEEDEEEEE